MRRDAARRIAAGDPEGHLTLGGMASFNARSASGDVDRDSVAVARRHFDAAIKLGSREAVQGRAMLVWMSDGLLAAEPCFRESARAGSLAGAELAALAISQRPRLERGLDARDVIGDPSARNDVGMIRFLQDSGFPDMTHRADGMIESLRMHAQSGDAAADSVLRALDLPRPSVAV